MRRYTNEQLNIRLETNPINTVYPKPLVHNYLRLVIHLKGVTIESLYRSVYTYEVERDANYQHRLCPVQSESSFPSQILQTNTGYRILLSMCLRWGFIIISLKELNNSVLI